MTPQAERVLEHFRKWGPDSDTNIGRCLKIPAASVRRSIQELIRAGYHISYKGLYNVYTWCRPDESTNIGGDDDADYQR